jgi:hypothetical protein
MRAELTCAIVQSLPFAGDVDANRMHEAKVSLVVADRVALGIKCSVHAVVARCLFPQANVQYALLVFVCQGKNIKASDLLGKSDCYVKVVYRHAVALLLTFPNALFTHPVGRSPLTTTRSAPLFAITVATPCGTRCLPFLVSIRSPTR